MRVRCCTYNGTVPASSSIDEWVAGNDPEDIIAIGFQEFVPLPNALSAYYPYTEEQVAYLERTLHKKTGVLYRALKYEVLGGIFLFLFVRNDSAVIRIESATAAVGLFNVVVNKGAAAIRVHLDSGQVLTFVSCHLHAGENNPYDVQRRNADFKTITERLVFPTQTSVYDTDHLFIFGDMNYRALSGTFDSDELSLERRKGNTAFSLSEAPVTFSHTYKYVPDSSALSPKRSPAWCDRILFSPSEALECLEYNSVTEVLGSDHRPVYAVFQLSEQAFGAKSLRDVSLTRLSSLHKYASRTTSLALGLPWFTYVTLGPLRLGIIIGVLVLWYLYRR